MKQLQSKLRFKRKTYGWGWTPVSWEGWLTTFGYIVGVFILTFFYGGTENNPPTTEMLTIIITGIVLLTIALLLICYKKGETPKRQWGDKKESL